MVIYSRGITTVGFCCLYIPNSLLPSSQRGGRIFYLTLTECSQRPSQNDILSKYQKMLWEEIRASLLLCSYPDGSATVTSFVPFNSKPRGKSAAMKIYFTKLIGEFSSEIAEKVTSKRSSALGPHTPPPGEERVRGRGTNGNPLRGSL